MCSETPIPTWENLLNDSDLEMCQQHLDSQMTKIEKSYSIYKHFDIPPHIQEDIEILNKLDSNYEIIVKNILMRRGISFYTQECFPCRIITE